MSEVRWGLKGVCFTPCFVALAIPYSSESNISFSEKRLLLARTIVMPDLIVTTLDPDFPPRRESSE